MKMNFKKNLRVLIVDHDQTFLDVAIRKLSQRNFSVVTALSTEEAIDILNKENIDAVVLNFNKANASGMKIIEFIHSLKKKPTILPLSSNGFEFFETQLA